MFAGQIRWQLDWHVEIRLIIWRVKAEARVRVSVDQLKRVISETHLGLEIVRSFQGAQIEFEVSQVVVNQFHLYVDSVVYSVPKITWKY